MRRFLLASMLSCGCGGGSPVAVELPPYSDRNIERDCEPVFGTRDGIYAVEAAPDGSWVAACQSREDTNGDGRVHTYIEDQHGTPSGDRLVHLLMHAGAPEGEPIDDYLGRDVQGRIALLVRGATLVVREMASGRERAIPSHFVDANSFYLTEAHPAGTHVLYTRGAGQAMELVERALTDDSEHVIAVPAGRITSARYLRRGRAFGVSVVSHDTNGNGTLDAPTRHTRMHCIPREPVAGTDVVVEHVLGRARGTETDTLLSVGEDADLVRREDGSLAVVLETGETSTTVPTSCARDVLAFWDEGRSILVHCDGDRDGALSAFYSAGMHAIRVAGSPRPPEAIVTGRVVRIDGNLAVRFDFATKTIIRDAEILGSSEHGILESFYGGDVYFRPYDSIDSPRFVLEIGSIRSEGRAYVRRFGASIVFFGHDALFVYNTARQRLGSLPELPYAMGADGRALIVSRDAGNRGPLCWLTP